MEMKWDILLRLLTLLQLIALSQHSHVQEAKRHIRQELNGIAPHHHHTQPHYHHHHHHHSRPQHRLHPRTPRDRWSGRRRSVESHTLFTGWTAWSACSSTGHHAHHDGGGGVECVRRRERFCRRKRKCGHTKHVEERPCWSGCHHDTPPPPPIVVHESVPVSPPLMHHHTSSNAPQAIIINTAGGAAPHYTPTPPPVPVTAIVVEPITVQPTPPTPYDPPPLTTYGPPPPPFVEAGKEVFFDDYDGENEVYDDEDDEEDDKNDYYYFNGETTIDNDWHHDSPEDVLDRLHSGERGDFYVIRRPLQRPRQQRPRPARMENQKSETKQEDVFAEAPNVIHAPDFSTEDDGDGDDEERQEPPAPRLKQGGRNERRLRAEQRHQRRQQQKRRRRQRRLQGDRWPRRRSDDSVISGERTKDNLRALDVTADSGIEGDIFQYEDFDFIRSTPAPERRMDSRETSDSYEDVDYNSAGNGLIGRNISSTTQKDAPPLPRARRLYFKWSRWTKCSPKCTTRRYKKCRIREQCGRDVLREIAYCYTEGSFCQQWLQAQVHKSPAYDVRPAAVSAGSALAGLTARRRELSDGGSDGGGGGGAQANAIVNDFIMNGKGYRGPEYSPQKLRCGIPELHGGSAGSRRNNLANMLKIIGGKAARRGEWPWQVAIFNRFKEAFCGGTLVAHQWVLTAAHCVRKVLYVRIGEHNLDYEDGTEMQLRVLRSFKHPSFDKKTVDSDVALLKLPKPVNASSWVGFSCLPQPFQPLPKNVDCTVIGWGKRRNRDVAGTSVLHQAEVPIIPMDNCRSVYHDYTITKNMFCAGHRRGRVDTCAGDSGGPLLCRDTTKPNHPWTIFGITSFGDGCAKRNKFGIYAKVPNYVDWVWSVINCNGNCKQQRGYIDQ